MYFSLYVYVWLPWLRIFRAFSSVVRQMPGQNPQRRGTVRTLPNFCVVVCIVRFVTYSVLFVCTCVLNYCHRAATHLQLNIYYHIILRPILGAVSIKDLSFTHLNTCHTQGISINVYRIFMTTLSQIHATGHGGINFKLVVNELSITPEVWYGH
jgi:hypothetical protein